MRPVSAEQRNPYEGDPPRAWIVLRLTAPDGKIHELKLAADTGSPFALIVSPDTPGALSHVEAPNIDTNFGLLKGAWFQLSMPTFGLTQKILGYGSDDVVLSVNASQPEFVGLVGLPLLRLLQYEGDADSFGIRRRRRKRKPARK